VRSGKSPLMAGNSSRNAGANMTAPSMARVLAVIAMTRLTGSTHQIARRFEMNSPIGG